MAATLLKPSMFRQACVSIPSKRAFATQASVATKSTFRSFTHPTSCTSPLLGRSNGLKTLGALTKQARVAAFHASSRKNILPMGPQVIEGTTNDPAPVPKPEPIHGSYHWTFERLIAVGLVPLTVVPFAAGTLNPTLDALFVTILIIHSHIGFESCVIDYFPKKHYPLLRSFMTWLLRAATLATAVGFYEFETHDVGITEGVKRIWKA